MSGCGTGSRVENYSALPDEAGDESRPSGLVGSAAAATCVSMKEFMKKDKIRPGTLLVIPGVTTMAGAFSVFVGLEQKGHAAGDFVCRLLQCDCIPAAGGQLDGETCAVVVVVTFQRFDDEISNGKPNGAPPVGVATKHVAVTLSRNIAHDFVFPLNIQGKGVVLMKPRE